ncbi:MAG: EpsG family protein [Clostridia bacterium]|nr:EpsG family protein [Clostridia bacterium]
MYKNNTKKSVIQTKNGVYEKQIYSVIYVLITLFALWFFVGFRTGGVGDTANYIYRYRITPTTFEFPSFSSTYLMEFLRRFFKAFVSTNPTVWLLFVATITVIPLAAGLAEFSIDLGVSISFYILSGCFEYFFNGARQLIAIAICFYAAKYLVREKVVHYVILVGVASLFHPSSLVMLSAIVLYKIKPWSNYTTVIIAFCVVLLLLPKSFTADLVTDATAGTSYSAYGRSLQTNGANPVRSVVMVIPTVLSYLFREKIKELDDPILNFSVNMSLVNSLLYVFAIFYNALVVTRIAAYFIVFLMVLYPYLFNYVLPKGSKYFKGLFYIFFLIYFIYQMYFIYGGLPYRSTTLGIRA